MNIQDLMIAFRQTGSGEDMGRVVLIVALVAVALVVLIALSLLLYSRSPRGRVDALLDERAQRSIASRWTVRLVMVFLFVGAILFTRYQLFQPSQCESCHTSVDWSETVSASPHADIDCMACHGSSGFVAPVQDAATYARWVIVNASEQKEVEVAPGSVDSADCLECHDNVRFETLTNRGIRVRHSDFLGEGLGCRECHNSIAHGDAVLQPTTPGMNRCVVCHDGDRAPSDCGYCHVEDPLLSKAVASSLPKIKTLDTGNCYACHEETPCLECHGVTMPHPEGWAPGEGGPGQSGTHARQGFANRELCWRCHFAEGKPLVAAREGCSCHGLFGRMHGGSAWVQEHWKQATGVKGAETSECFMCHGEYLCDQCHPESYRDLYNPQPGTSDYEREIPYDPDYWEW
ncbi:MAG: hypothetical protein OEV43_02475 [Coriobacteriia bacterium]|nr:hypothetical protein [Coriobacteriia bacterium]